MRIDQYLVLNGYFDSRQKAIDAIKDNQIKLNDIIITKPSHIIKNTDILSVIDDQISFVSRAGFKLHHALKMFNIDLTGKVVFDIGSSTGGFTDCCLKCKARMVYAIDVGSAQLAEKLRNDERVIVKENTNARYLKKDDFSILPDFICMDVSFISITLLIPMIAELLVMDKEAILLYKPQFEVGRSYLYKRGVVKDKKREVVVLSQIISLLESYKLLESKYIQSPIKGRNGNTEYLIYVKKA